MAADIPRGREERPDQATRKNSAGLQGGNAENLSGMGRVVAPVIDDVENLRAENSAEDYQNSEVPDFLAVHAQAFGVADAYPQAREDSERDQESVGRQEELPVMQELWVHSRLDAGNARFATLSVLLDQSSRKGWSA